LPSCRAHGTLQGVNLPQALLSVGIAVAAGGLIGVEREQAQREVSDAKRDFGGIRTFPLIALLGAVGALLRPALGPWLLAGFLLGVAGLLAISHARAQDEDPGVSSEVAALVTFGAGAIAGSVDLLDDVSRFQLVAAIAGVTMALLALKRVLHGFVAKLSSDDLFATAKFALVALVLLPILPDRTYGPLDVINPAKIGLMIVLIAGVSFAGYAASRVFGGSRGMLLTGLVGGLVSSTAVTMTFAGRTKEEPRVGGVAAVAIVAASSTMFARIVLVVGIVDRSLVSSVAAPLLVMAVLGFAAAAIAYRRDAGRGGGKEVPLRNPFELTKAVQFGLLYGVVLLVAKAAQVYLGSGGVLASAVLAGLTDVDAITLSLADLHKQGLDSDTAALGIGLAAVTNTTVKAGIAATLGGVRLGARVGALLGIAVLGGLASLLLLR
jgi:uncharacterized membrane protein (DUF4010 family)